MRKASIAVFPSLFVLLLALSVHAQSSSAPDQSRPPSDQSSTPPPLVLPPQTLVALSLQTALNSRLNEVGDQVSAVLKESVRDREGRVVIVRGTEFTGRVTLVQPAGRFQKEAKMTVVFDRVHLPYGEETIATIVTAIDDLANEHKLKSKDNEGKVGGGHSDRRTTENLGRGATAGGVSGLVGVLAGVGGAGMVAGAIIVGAVGGVLLTKGNDIRLAPGTILRIRFERPLTVPAAP